MNYSDLTSDQAQRLKLLKDRIVDANIPASSLDQSLKIASWNIRDFGKASRTADALLFITEIIYQFDIVAIVELRDDIRDLKKVLERLGPNWKVVLSDWQDDWGGNWERTAFVYDERMVEFTGLAAEAQPDRKKVGTEYISQQSWWRSPYMASFKAGTFDFILMATHARWGKSEDERKMELASFSNWIYQRWHDKKDKVIDKDLLLMGDFNIPEVGDDLYKALTTKAKLKMPESIAGITDTAVSKGKDRRYDQILHLQSSKIQFANEGGIIDFAKGGLMEKLLPNIEKSRLTYELSDHFPLWVRVNVENDVAILDSILDQKG